MKKHLLFMLLLFPAMAWSQQCASLIDAMDNIGQLKTILHCLDDAIANHRRNGVVKPLQHDTIKAQKLLAGYRFEVEHCSRTQAGFQCAVIITNRNKSVYSPDYREFGIYTADSHFYNEYGEQFQAIRGQMGQDIVDANGPSNRKNFKDGYLEKYMPIGVPIRLVLRFSEISRKTQTVLALNIRFSHRDGKDLSSKYVTLEGIAVTEH